ncbi:MAG: cytochrome c [Chloroflexi bacterium]|nr:cytochrome c [Chloroflexota bacterium]
MNSDIRIRRSNRWGRVNLRIRMLFAVSLGLAATLGLLSGAGCAGDPARPTPLGSATPASSREDTPPSPGQRQEADARIAPISGQTQSQLVPTVEIPASPMIPVDLMRSPVVDPSADAAVITDANDDAARKAARIEEGQLYWIRYGCRGCHTINGFAAMAPTWKGLFGSEGALTDGTTVIADEAFIRESIIDPDAKVVAGFRPGFMTQDLADQLTPEQVEALVAFIRSVA